MAAYLPSWTDAPVPVNFSTTNVVADWSTGGPPAAAPQVLPGAVGEGPEDGRLFIRIAAGDGDAFAAFYDRYASLFFGLAWRILENDQECEDVVQEASVSLWERAPQYDPALGRPLSWAVTIVRNRAIDRLRSRNRRAAVFAEAEESGDAPEPTVDSRSAAAADLADTATMVRKTLIQLPAPQREALELAFFGGLTHLEIADQLALPLGTIKARIRRGLLALRDTLEGHL